MGVGCPRRQLAVRRLLVLVTTGWISSFTRLVVDRCPPCPLFLNKV